MAHNTTYFGDEDGIQVVAAIEMATGAVFRKVEDHRSYRGGACSSCGGSLEPLTEVWLPCKES